VFSKIVGTFKLSPQPAAPALWRPTHQYGTYRSCPMANTSGEVFQMSAQYLRTTWLL
jgi:hypothetical protein